MVDYSGNITSKHSFSANIHVSKTYNIETSFYSLNQTALSVENNNSFDVSSDFTSKNTFSAYVNAHRTRTLPARIRANKEAYNVGECPVATIEHIGFSPNSIIDTVDRSQNIYENSKFFCQIQKIKCSLKASAQSKNRITLVSRRGGRASQMIN